MLIDGLQCGHFSAESLMALREADVGCVTVTTAFWEDAVETMDRIAAFRDLVRENAAIVRIARSSAEIVEINAEGKLALILGSQNSNLLNDRIRFVELFADMGIRVIQLTYNNQNELAGSCYEAEDSGLARFGREVIHEMNRAGILVDLSHVGNRSTLDAIRWSKKPVAVTHANADSLFAHKRNKTDEVLHALRDTGGIMGCAVYRNITGDHYLSTVDNWCEMVARTVEIAGIDHVGVGTDLSHAHEAADYDWMRRGRWTRGVDYGAGSPERPGKVARAEWLVDLRGLALIAPALRRVGFSEEEAGKLLRGNWLRVYEDVFGA